MSEAVLIYVGSVLGIVHTVALCGLIFFFSLGMSLIGIGNFYPGAMTQVRRKSLLRKGWACFQMAFILGVILMIVPSEGIVREMAGLPNAMSVGGCE